MYDESSSQDGLFNRYIDTFFKWKVEASGFPARCKTEEEKSEYIREIEEVEKIKVCRESVECNAGLRLVPKNCLNSLWGRIGMNENHKQTELIRDETKFFNLLSDPEITVHSFLPVNNDAVYVNYSKCEEKREEY